MLKRIREALKRQDWTAVFIELMIVVLGVMIAFQVSEWSAKNVERQREQREKCRNTKSMFHKKVS